jgi:inhibitor of KinA
MLDHKMLLAGDTALVVEFGERIDLQLSARVLALARRLTDSRIEGIVETVPTIRSLIVYFEPLVISAAALQGRISQLIEGLQTTEQNGRTWHLPACYDAEIAPDLPEVAARTGLSQAQVVERHSGTTYHVYMLGFLPGLAYMGDVPHELALPRRESPRPKIPAGSVGIGMTMTCVYPMDTPCGWHLIARSPVALWDRRRGTGALLAAGDHVAFKPVSLREYEGLLTRAEEGALQIAPVH